MNTLYLECNSGISGDMLVAALLGLGADEEVLRKALDSIPAQGFTYVVSRVKKAGVDCCDFAVILDEEHENHDHDMEYLHAHGYEHTHDHHHHEHEHTHDHQHEHGHGHEHGHQHQHETLHEVHHRHEHRGLKEIIAIINEVSMTASARALALKIFDIIAVAEEKHMLLSRRMCISTRSVQLIPSWI